MKSASEFYEGLHSVEKNFSAGSYHMPSLFRLVALRRWMEGRTGQPLRLLDVGCGKGLFLREFTVGLKLHWQAQPTRVVGLDLVRSPGDYFAEVSDRFEFVAHNLEGNVLPFPDASFDFVCCNHVLEHVFETERLVREFRRVLDPGGLCLISVPNLAAWINRIGLLWGGQPLGSEIGTERITYGFRPRWLQAKLAAFRPSGHIRVFTPHGLQDLTQACGFETLGWWRQSKGPIARLSRWSGREMGIVVKPASDQAPLPAMKLNTTASAKPNR